MAKYDGLIIPRSYSEYLNKTDAATLSQMLDTLGGTMDAVPTAGSQKAARSGGIFDAINIITSVMSVEVVQNKDLNECIVLENKTCVSIWNDYQSGTEIPNAPSNNNFFVISFQLVNPTNANILRLTQIAIQNNGSNPTPGNMYIRQGATTTGINNITWGNWQTFYWGDPNWVDTGIISGSNNEIAYKKIGNIVFLHIDSVESALKFTSTGTTLRKSDNSIVYLPTAIRPAKNVNTTMIDNIDDVIFRCRVRTDGTIVSWNMPGKNVTAVTSWQTDICYTVAGL